MTDKPLNCIGINPTKQRIGAHDFKQRMPGSAIPPDVQGRRIVTTGLKQPLVERVAKMIGEMVYVNQCSPEQTAQTVLEACHVDELVEALRVTTGLVEVLTDTGLSPAMVLHKSFKAQQVLNRAVLAKFKDQHDRHEAIACRERGEGNQPVDERPNAPVPAQLGTATGIDSHRVSEPSPGCSGRLPRRGTSRSLAGANGRMCHNAGFPGS
jgi:hypothetical protein